MGIFKKYRIDKHYRRSNTIIESYHSILSLWCWAKPVVLTDKYENFDTLTNTMLNELVEKIPVHECDRKGSQDTTQEVEIYFNFVGRYVPPHFGEVNLTPEEQEELRKKEERIKTEKRRQMEAKKATLRVEDMEKGVFIPISDLPQQQPQQATFTTRTAIR